MTLESRPMFDEVPPQPSYQEVEAKVLEFWKEKDVFKRSEAKEGPNFVFYEGPPTANGQPAMHHVLARAFKDLFPRYKSMKGFKVSRKGGWDTHGLPVEVAVEKKLGLRGRNHGASRDEMQEFNKLCRESVFTNIQDWNYFTDRMGYWVDLEKPYVTYHDDYIESVWNLLKRLWDKGLIERDYKVVPVSPRIGTTLSANEIADGYRMVDDPSVYVRFPVKPETTPAALRASLESQGVKLEDLEKLALVIWTTTPWTLPSNTMAAVNPDLEYVIAKTHMGHIVIAAGAVERMGVPLYKDQPALEVVARFKGDLMEFWQYEQPFPEVFDDLNLNGDKWSNGPSAHPRAHFVALADFVTDEDGSGVAHEAPVYGAEDLELSRKYGSVLCFGTNGNGIMQVTSEKGKFFKDADRGLVREMRDRGVMFWAGQINHSYPFHDRTDDPILYYARPSWFVRTNKMRHKLAEENQKINWVPAHIKDGRFGNWLENNVDWSISRERFWGTPLPFWRSEDSSETICIGSVAELEKLSGQDLSKMDLHRPYIDDITFERGGKTFSRVPEVLDVWFDSGSMPFAQWHLILGPDGVAQDPVVLKQFQSQFPADFICEAIDQTRGWFYSLHAISVLLTGEPAFKNVICLGHLVDEKGQKMSKSKGNVVDPIPAFDKYGADSVRWYMFTASEPGDTKRFSERLVAEGQRGFINTLWNVYSFFTLYANLDKPDLQNPPALESRPEIDRWLVSKLEQTIQVMTDCLEAYDARGAGKSLEALIEALSNWYVRRNRRRFWTQDGQVDQAAYATLYEALTTCAKLAAPFTPFLAEALYQNLVPRVDANAPDSVHLCAYPEFNAARCDAKLVSEMEAVMKVVDLGRAARGQANLKLRQPLAKVMVRARTSEDARALERFSDQISEELNVKLVSFLEEGADLVQYTLKPNLPTLGRKYGKSIPAIRAALSGDNTASIAKAARDGQNIQLETSDGTFDLEPADILVDAKSPEGYAALEAEGFLVAFDSTLSPELEREGIARDLVRAIQQARKDADFDVSDHITVRLNLDGQMLEAAKEWQEFIKGETLSDDLEFAFPSSGDVIVPLEDGGSLGLKRA
jgi:isoleucyl-tRNA synthetase